MHPLARKVLKRLHWLVLYQEKSIKYFVGFQVMSAAMLIRTQMRQSQVYLKELHMFQ